MSAIKENEANEKEMSFLEHLEELRWRIIKALIGLLIAVLVCSFFSNWIVNDLIILPSKQTNPPLHLINTIPYGQITFYMVVILLAGIIVSLPWILYQGWKFIQPGLLPNERKYISSIVVFTSLCFLAGVAFAYFIALPYMLQFFATFGTQNIQNMISISEYASFVLHIILISGLIFELPMVSYFLARLGVITPTFMKRYRRHSIVIILIIAAVVTPTTDPFTMGVFAIPMILLYEFSIFIAKIAQARRNSVSLAS